MLYCTTKSYIPSWFLPSTRGWWRRTI